MHKDAWKSLSSKVVYENKWGRRIREHQIIRPDGTEGTYAVFEVDPGVYVIALNENQEVYLIGQYRFPIRKYSLEFPSGGTDGEDPLVAAKRELQEETGLTASKWTALGEFYQSTGSSNEKGLLFLAEELTQTEQHEKEEEGISEVRKVKIEELLTMIKNGEVVDGAVMASLLLAADHLNITL